MTPPAPLNVPPALCEGDAISIVAPASSPKREAFDVAMANLTALGYRPKTYRYLCKPHGYLSGTDAERADELNQAFADPETTMVLAARGGYGCGRILDQVDFGLLADRPKIVSGYSDLTALHAAIQRRSGLVSFHGPNLVGGWGDDTSASQAERDAALALFSGQSGAGSELLPATDSMRSLSDGTAIGRLVGGNLAVLVSLVGTPDEPDFDGAILVVEDIGEAPYRIDRLLTQLRMAGVLDQIAGAVLGYFTDADPDGGPSAEAVLTEFLQPLGVPVAMGAPVGHEHPNFPLPFGARVILDVNGNGKGISLTLDQTVVASAR
ncbi:putative murein peptide carboxypeptidase [Botrimarina colliarenosi]|uniref:Putative murein peptide carboxypeptidase n=1 Tax=Botrimarina colliarenosi TaxID=2528001 RepID=A0A5C6A232_9BACT|nr:LD-carboxypeptidase [Botrimarina colliarenosi]TWT93465.1 putative murein peptide carboxypeptidase [Botrimarina colliarenosi]